MYKYETHLHTFPVSKCAVSPVRESLEYYKQHNYDGVFITNHFLDGNIGIDKELPYEEKLDFFFSDYKEALEIGKELGIKVFLGYELSYKGTDFLVYGLDADWFYAHPEIMDMKKSEELPYLQEAGALVVQAHPYLKARYLDHIRLYPQYVQGAEVLNSSRPEAENTIAQFFAQHYDLIPFAGSDFHGTGRTKPLSGMASQTPITSEKEFVEMALAGQLEIFLEEQENV